MSLCSSRWSDAGALCIGLLQLGEVRVQSLHILTSLSDFNADAL